MTLLEIMSALDNNEELHLARLIVLLGVLTGKDGQQPVKGLTKLAKLDFLLRYPLFLERAVEYVRGNTARIKVRAHESLSVESSMVRYRYGPWDFRYRKFLSLLVGMGLVNIMPEGRSMNITLTADGVKLASRISQMAEFGDFFDRSRVIRTHFDLGGTNLMHLMYKIFPELSSLRLGSEITYVH